MICIISPSKTMDFERKFAIGEYSIPEFLEEAHEISSILKQYSPEDLCELMGISKELGEKNFFRFQNWSKDIDQSTKQAIIAFTGDVYRGINVQDFGKEDYLFAQEHLRILSGLYGLLKPLDLIKPYRLEMGIKVKNNMGDNLYSFWKHKLTLNLLEQLQRQSAKVLVNLASEEYSKAIDFKKLTPGITTIAPIFKEYRGGKYKVIAIYAKRARGLMASYIIKNRIENLEELKNFNLEGYEYNEVLSSKGEFIFTRNQRE